MNQLPLKISLILTTMGLSVFAVVAPIKVGATNQNCTPSQTLINPCRAWIGAAAHGNPGAPNDAVSQFNYLETLSDNQLDIYRDYHAPLGTANNSDASLPADPSTTAGQAEGQLAKSGKILDLNWDVSHTWAQAAPVSAGGDATINAEIDQTAGFIKKLPNMVFLSPWHENNLHVSAQDNSSENCSHFNNTEGYGSPGQFVAAWQNIYNKFKADGVTNVVWVLNYGTYAPNNCWINYMWPGNDYVDWVIYDTYSRGKTWQDTSGVFYNYLSSHSSSSVDFDSKPWGIGEFGTCKQPTGGTSEAGYFQSATQAVQANTYPKLRMYLIFADTGNNSGTGCLTNYDSNGQKDAAKQASWNQLVSAILGTSLSPMPSSNPGLGSGASSIPKTGPALIGLIGSGVLAVCVYLFYRYRRRKHQALAAARPVNDADNKTPPSQSLPS